jgi:hypothetical protein
MHELTAKTRRPPGFLDADGRGIARMISTRILAQSCRARRENLKKNITAKTRRRREGRQGFQDADERGMARMISTRILAQNR